MTNLRSGYGHCDIQAPLARCSDITENKGVRQQDKSVEINGEEYNIYMSYDSYSDCAEGPLTKFARDLDLALASAKDRVSCARGGGGGVSEGSRAAPRLGVARLACTHA